MRFLYGLFAFIIWGALGPIFSEWDIPFEVQVLSLAIVVAGAMVGGD